MCQCVVTFAGNPPEHKTASMIPPANAAQFSDDLSSMKKINYQTFDQEIPFGTEIYLQIIGSFSMT